MDNRLSLDTETDIPLGRLVPAPFNPKSPITGPYRKGLETSIDEFGLRDRLHVWPDPGKPGYYVVLDGNQRLAACEDMVLDRLVREHFQLAPETPLARVAAIREDESNAKVVKSLRTKGLKTPIPCQVITRLDEETPFSLEHAKLFTSIWNRNHAKYDEVKQADLFRDIRESMMARADYRSERKAILESRLKTMMRPEMPMAPAPSSPPPGPSQPPAQFTFAPPGEFTPTKEEPWGPPPPSPSPDSTIPDAPSRPAPVFVPIVFSLTEEGYNQVTGSVLRSKARAFRETRLIEALGKLEKVCSASELDKAVESAIVEVALRIFNMRIEAAGGESKA